MKRWPGRCAGLRHDAGDYARPIREGSPQSPGDLLGAPLQLQIVLDDLAQFVDYGEMASPVPAGPFPGPPKLFETAEIIEATIIADRTWVVWALGAGSDVRSEAIRADRARAAEPHLA